MKYISIIAIGLLFMTSCQSVVDDVDIPQLEQKNVIQVNLSNFGDNHIAHFTKTNPVFNGSPDGEFEIVLDASIQVVGDAGIDSFSYDEFEEAYYAPNKAQFVVGQQYELVAKTADGKELTSAVVYPEGPANVSMAIDSNVYKNQKEYMFDVSWDKVSDQGKYYEVEMFSIFEYDNELDTVASARRYVDATDLSGRITRQLISYVYTGPGGAGGLDVSKQIILISGITKEHYEYARFLQTYEPENPTSEPVSIPTNIQGGLGMFVMKNTVRVQ